MDAVKYLTNILIGQGSDMINDMIFVILPVLSITVLMFSLRCIFEDYLNPKLKKQ